MATILFDEPTITVFVMKLTFSIAHYTGQYGPYFIKYSTTKDYEALVLYNTLLFQTYRLSKMLDPELQQILHHKIQFQPLHLQVLFEVIICRNYNNHLINPIEYAISLND